MVDFRNYNYGLDKLIADNGYDQILVLYNFDSFKSDPYLYRAGVTGENNQMPKLLQAIFTNL